MGGENLSCAVDHVIRWATTVMTAVEKIQWRPLGKYYSHIMNFSYSILFLRSVTIRFPACGDEYFGVLLKINF